MHHVPLPTRQQRPEVVHVSQHRFALPAEGPEEAPVLEEEAAHSVSAAAQSLGQTQHEAGMTAQAAFVRSQQ
jgi:hypothetical protein